MDRRKFLLLASQSALLSSLGLHFLTARAKTSDADLDELLPRLLKETKTPAISLAVIRDGKVAWNKAFGVKDTTTNEPVDINTTFEAASVSKTVFAYAIMKLCEKKIINLDTPLFQYYPQLFSDGDPRLKLITARLVLSHQTGLPDWRSGPLAFTFDPGKNFEYSGEGYYLLQTVITHLVGKTYTEPCGTYEGDLKVCATNISEYLKENILFPFGMNSSTYLWSAEMEKNNASAHGADEKVIRKGHQNAADMARYASAGGLITSSKDYSKFLIGLFESKDQDVYRLNRASISEMTRPQVKLPPNGLIDNCTSWALGWGIQEHPAGKVIVHSGGQSGFRSLAMASLEKKSGFIALTNGDNGGFVLYKLAEVLNELW